MWIKKDEKLSEENQMKKDQMVLLYWPPGWKNNYHQGELKPASPEIGCFIYKGKEKDGCDIFHFVWGTGRFGHPSTHFSTHWMPFSLP